MKTSNTLIAGHREISLERQGHCPNSLAFIQLDGSTETAWRENE